MNEVEKINAVVNELGSIYKLTLEQTNLIKSNIMKRSELYKNIKPTINPNETAFIKNTSTITDILLNRLINNIRVYDFRDNYNMSVKEKGTYAANSQTLTLEGNQFLYDVTYKKLKERNPNITEDIVKKASEKVKNHEFGHALQTSFNGIEGMYNEKLIQVINNLNIKYPSIFKNYNDLSKNKLNKIHGGLVQSILNKVETEEEKIKNYYGRFAKFNFGEHNIDEIFNDDEAISISDMNNPQFEYNYQDGSIKNIYNYESSNYRITSYAKMMKLLMGKERTYRSMYEDSFELYKFIDQFQKISNNLYDKEIPPMVNIMNSIITIKQNNDLREMKRLDLFFTKCLQSKVNYQLNKENFTSDELKKIVKQIKMFKMQMITNAKILLESNMIIQDIQHKVDEKYNEIINNNQQKISNNEPQRKFRK